MRRGGGVSLTLQNFCFSDFHPPGFVFFQILQMIPAVTHLEISLFGSPGIYVIECCPLLIACWERKWYCQLL